MNKSAVGGLTLSLFFSNLISSVGFFFPTRRPFVVFTLIFLPLLVSPVSLSLLTFPTVLSLISLSPSVRPSSSAGSLIAVMFLRNTFYRESHDRTGKTSETKALVKSDFNESSHDEAEVLTHRSGALMDQLCFSQIKISPGFSVHSVSGHSSLLQVHSRVRSSLCRTLTEFPNVCVSLQGQSSLCLVIISTDEDISVESPQTWWSSSSFSFSWSESQDFFFHSSVPDLHPCLLSKSRL